MPIAFSCPTCKAKLSSKEKNVGVKFNCPRCGQRVQVPTPPPTPTDHTMMGELNAVTGQALLGDPPAGITVPGQAANAQAPGVFDFSAPVPVAQPIVLASAAVPAAAQVDVGVRGFTKQSSYGLVSLIVGILGFFVCILLGPVAIVLGKRGLKEDREDGFAKAGVLLGWIQTALCLAGVGLFALSVIAEIAMFYTITRAIPGPAATKAFHP